MSGSGISPPSDPGDDPAPRPGDAAAGSLLPVHGGDLAWAEWRFGVPETDWIDLSTGINPWPYPGTSFDAGCLSRLPDARARDALLRAAADYYGTEPDSILALPGTQAGILALPAMMAPGRVAVLSPTYGDHAAAWRSAGHLVAEVTEEAALWGDWHAAVVTNPNNPDGRRLSAETLRALALNYAERGAVLVVDEAFADVTPGLSVAPEAGRIGSPAAGLLVFRSFGKFFGLGGLRLGFMIGPRMYRHRLAERLGSWSVSGPALEIGARALADHAWQSEARARLAAARVRLDALLTQAGIQVRGGTDLFRLVDCSHASQVMETLGKRGILVRPFGYAPNWLRIGLPATPEAESRLAAALADC